MAAGVCFWRLHGVSIYGWQEGRDDGFAARHLQLKSGKATMRLRQADAADIPTTNSPA